MIPTAQQISVPPDPWSGVLPGSFTFESEYAAHAVSFMHDEPDILPLRELLASMDVMLETFKPWYDTQDEPMMAADATPIHPGTSVSTGMLGWPDNYGAEDIAFSHPWDASPNAPSSLSTPYSEDSLSLLPNSPSLIDALPEVEPDIASSHPWDESPNTHFSLSSPFSEHSLAFSPSSPSSVQSLPEVELVGCAFAHNQNKTHRVDHVDSCGSPSDGQNTVQPNHDPGILFLTSEFDVLPPAHASTIVTPSSAGPATTISTGTPDYTPDHPSNASSKESGPRRSSRLAQRVHKRLLDDTDNSLEDEYLPGMDDGASRDTSRANKRRRTVDRKADGSIDQGANLHFCPICGRGFGREHDMKRHVETTRHKHALTEEEKVKIYAVKDDDKRWWCAWCREIKARKDSRVRHERHYCEINPDVVPPPPRVVKKAATGRSQQRKGTAARARNAARDGFY
ncbi:hypothetical protein PUNSTDRAFT_135343 [Punctularia strigosozonata HHB-11173 SS5]|uniref:uncharacterized protein n=1 Tax=Punctularia strigosozonata (strain HHB-11173) TaxID=741275 RepID=UPI00044174A5|nr:uncharacterized protein PUNSTDRAFT_135343 [Punctularia strigosozonata HHB-11173 SS5]EIN07828.1 hypothetical protein PUNSTDRAFT_135343 [Punctularia strigosozonata HHB-11173 SS5]